MTLHLFYIHLHVSCSHICDMLCVCFYLYCYSYSAHRYKQMEVLTTTICNFFMLKYETTTICCLHSHFFKKHLIFYSPSVLLFGWAHASHTYTHSAVHSRWQDISQITTTEMWLMLFTKNMLVEQNRFEREKDLTFPLKKAHSCCGNTLEFGEGQVTRWKADWPLSSMDSSVEPIVRAYGHEKLLSDSQFLCGQDRESAGALIVTFAVSWESCCAGTCIVAELAARLREPVHNHSCAVYLGWYHCSFWITF